MREKNAEGENGSKWLSEIKTGRKIQRKEEKRKSKKEKKRETEHVD